MLQRFALSATPLSATGRHEAVAGLDCRWSTPWDAPACCLRFMRNTAIQLRSAADDAYGNFAAMLGAAALTFKSPIPRLGPFGQGHKNVLTMAAAGIALIG